MARAEPDEVIDHRPAGVCGCGADLAGAADLGVARSRQQLEVPLMTARRVQHDLHQARCGCGTVHVAARPEGVPDSAASIGPNVRPGRVPGGLPARVHRPVRAADRGRDRRAGLGGFHPLLPGQGRRGDRGRGEADQDADHRRGGGRGFDETTLRCLPAGTKKYVLAAVTELCSLFFLGRRTLEPFREFGVLPAFAGVVVADRYANYFQQGWEHIVGNQACLAHLIRDYEDAAECWPDAVWPVQALRSLISAWHTARNAGQAEIPPHIRDPLTREFRHAVLAGLSDVPRIPGPKNTTAQRPGRDLLEFCRDRRADVTRFCFDTRIWPSNNISERGVRPVKTQQIISGRLTSEEPTQDRLDIRSYINTARKHGHNVMDVLRSVMTGAPWRPPVPAPT